MERSNIIKIKGQPMTLVGRELKVGDKAPDFILTNTDMKPVKLSDSRGKTRLISVVTSLETLTCNVQTRTFNEKLAELSDDVAVYTISADLPFAQSRYNAENKIDKVQTLSNYRDDSFGNDYGLLIKELGLLARAVLVVDKDDRITHMQIVPEQTTEPDYTSALAAVKAAIK